MKQAIRDALDSSSRVASTGSRLLSGHDEAGRQLKMISRALGWRRSGTLFHFGVCGEYRIAERHSPSEDAVFSDSGNHASLIDGISPRQVQACYFSASRSQRPSKPNFAGLFPVLERRFIVVEAFSAWTATARRFGISQRSRRAMTQNSSWMKLMATGVCGAGGRGCVAEAGLAGRVFASVHTCGKALAAAGALRLWLGGAAPLLINRSRIFIFNTALPPYFAAQVAGRNASGRSCGNWTHARGKSRQFFSETSCKETALISRGAIRICAHRAGIERGCARFWRRACKPRLRHSCDSPADGSAWNGSLARVARSRSSRNPSSPILPGLDSNTQGSRTHSSDSISR